MGINVEELTLREIREIQAIAAAPSLSPKGHGVCLVIADRGHVWVGDCTVDADWCHIEDARAVRRWGTSSGLNELASKGPLPETVLDDAASLSVSRRAVIALVPVKDRKQWTT